MATPKPAKIEPQLKTMLDKPAVSAPSGRPGKSRLFWGLVVLLVLMFLPLVIGISWWLIDDGEWFNDGPTRPGFVDLGLMTRDLSNGHSVQMRTVIWTKTPDEAEQIRHYFPQLQRTAVFVMGHEFKNNLLTYEGKQEAANLLAESFRDTVDQDRASLIRGVVFSQFVIWEK